MERRNRDICLDFEDSNGRAVGSITTNGSVDQSNNAARRHGDHGLKITFDGTGLDCNVYETSGTDRSEIYARFNFLIDSNIGSLDLDVTYSIAIIADSTFTHVAVFYILMDNTTGNPNFFYCADSGGLSCYDLNTAPISGDTWYQIELYWLKGTSGKLEGRVNGTAFSNQGSGNNSTMSDIGSILLLGWSDDAQTLYPANTEYCYYDDGIADDEGWIGEYAIPWNRRRVG